MPINNPSRTRKGSGGPLQKIVSGIKKVGDAGPDAVTSELYPEMSIDVRAAETQKCERCWMRSETVGQDMNHPQICGRCSTVMAQIDGQG